MHQIPYFTFQQDLEAGKYIVTETPKRSLLLQPCPHVHNLIQNGEKWPPFPTLKELSALKVRQYDKDLQNPNIPQDLYDYITRGYDCGQCRKYSFSYGEPICRGISHCAKCVRKKNLWLCLTCGNYACGRKIPLEKQLPTFQGGDGHAIEHYEKTGHPLVCKLRSSSITFADVYCYDCQDSVKNPFLDGHLSHFGVRLETLLKTEPNLEEVDEEVKRPHRERFKRDPIYIFRDYS